MHAQGIHIVSFILICKTSAIIPQQFPSVTSSTLHFRNPIGSFLYYSTCRYTFDPRKLHTGNEDMHTSHLTKPLKIPKAAVV